MKLISLNLISPTLARALSVHGVHTVRQLLAICELKDCFKGICSEFSFRDEELEAILDEARRSFPATDAMLAPYAISAGMMGVFIDSEQIESNGFSVKEFKATAIRLVRGVPKQVSLAEKMPTVRSQGNRGACVAFGMIAAREYIEAEAGDQERLSEQDMYYLCKQNDGHPGPGTYPHVAVAQLNTMGVCTAKTWTYNQEHRAGNEGQGPPPPKARSEGLKFRINPAMSAPTSDIYWLKEFFSGDDACPIPFAVPVYASWGNAETRRTGDLVMPFSGERIQGGHMMAAVGYQDDSQAAGGGWVFFRNSWGIDWACESEVAPGYGRMPYAYWLKYCRSAYVLERAVEKPQSRSAVKATAKHAAIAAALIWLVVGTMVFRNLDDENREYPPIMKTEQTIEMPEVVTPLLDLIEDHLELEENNE